MMTKREDLIPKNTPYCYYDNFEPCPFWDVVQDENGEYIEYCNYLGEELSIPDQVKDCGISYWSEEEETYDD